jgi:hypothetical protein
MTDIIRDKATEVLWYAARRRHIRNMDQCLKEFCDEDPIIVQNIACSLGLFYHFGRDGFFWPSEFLCAFAEDDRAKKAHRMDSLSIPGVLRVFERERAEQEAYDLARCL